MTYRERREARADRLRGWAGKREAKADGLHAQNEPYRGDFAFNTQPGHIPERARANRRSEQAHKHTVKAAEMSARADSIDRAADHAIYSDDPDAIDALKTRIAGLEAQRERIKYINATIRKGPGWETRIDPPLSDREKSDLELAPRYILNPGPFKGYPGYHLTNLSGNIGRQRKRLAQLEIAADA
jgi:hypothetical protein|tara:strand:+ start:105 stop:659 length:555 start_codon:yes stop_codon:yes gene_type:complete